LRPIGNPLRRIAARSQPPEGYRPPSGNTQFAFENTCLASFSVRVLFGDFSGFCPATLFMKYCTATKIHGIAQNKSEKRDRDDAKYARGRCGKKGIILKVQNKNPNLSRKLIF